MSDLMMICIRCGSKEHSTRDHDEGKTGAAPIKSATGEVYGAPASPKKPSGAKRPVSGAASPSSPNGKIKNAALYASPSRVQPPQCWKNVKRNPGIPDIIAPKMVERNDHDGTCISFLAAMNCALKIECPCVTCQRKAEKAKIVADRKREDVEARLREGGY